jgi:hypothetical protein
MRISRFTVNWLVIIVLALTGFTMTVVVTASDSTLALRGAALQSTTPHSNPQLDATTPEAIPLGLDDPSPTLAAPTADQDSTDLNRDL